jgi:hypothetical protein
MDLNDSVEQILGKREDEEVIYLIQGARMPTARKA